MDSLEYKILNKCYPDLVTCIGQSPNEIADQLRPCDILSQGDVSFLENPTNSDAEKARKIISVVLNQVQTDPQVYFKLIKAMRASGDWTKTTLCKLEAQIMDNKQRSQEESGNYLHTSRLVY